MWDLLPVGTGQNVVVGHGVGNLFADSDHLSINDGDRRSVHKTVNEWRVGILINLLEPAGELFAG